MYIPLVSMLDSFYLVEGTTRVQDIITVFYALHTHLPHTPAHTGRSLEYETPLESCAQFFAKDTRVAQCQRTDAVAGDKTDGNTCKLINTSRKSWQQQQ